jgi:heat shock protein HtpX
MMRIFLFLATNIAILVVISLAFQLFGIQGVLDERGVDLQLGPLLLVSAIVGFSGSFVSLALSKWLAKRATGAVVIESPRNQAEQWLVERVSAHAKAAGIRMPEVAIFDAPDPNAFATGARRDAALVAVSTGLLREMNANEVDAVLGHEIGHVANGDMVTLALIQGVVNTFVFFLSRVIGHVVDRVVFKTERGHGPAYWITAIVAQIVLGILASIIVMWFSRQREFRADAAGARLAGRSNMISALEALKRRSEGAQPLPEQLGAFGISGGGRRRFSELFSTHPPLEARIEALQSHTA